VVEQPIRNRQVASSTLALGSIFLEELFHEFGRDPSVHFESTFRVRPIGGRTSFHFYGRRLSGVGRRLSAQATNPSFVALLEYLSIRVTGVFEEFAMLIDGQERHARL
jgi:hypothetical protein